MQVHNVTRTGVRKRTRDSVAVITSLFFFRGIIVTAKNDNVLIHFSLVFQEPKMTLSE